MILRVMCSLSFLSFISWLGFRQWVFHFLKSHFSSGENNTWAGKFHGHGIEIEKYHCLFMSSQRNALKSMLMVAANVLVSRTLWLYFWRTKSNMNWVWSVGLHTCFWVIPSSASLSNKQSWFFLAWIMSDSAHKCFWEEKLAPPPAPCEKASSRNFYLVKTRISWISTTWRHSSRGFETIALILCNNPSK